MDSAARTRAIDFMSAIDDWPQSYYRRAGFADAGRLARFFRT